MTPVPLPALADNYIWMLQDGAGAIVADPGDAKPAFDALARGNPKLAAILVTRHPAEHAGSDDAWPQTAGVPVSGPSGKAIACAAEPGRPEATQSLAQCDALRERGAPTLPSRMGTERCVNPFLRSREAALRASARARPGPAPQAAAVDAFAALRQWKNDFR